MPDASEAFLALYSTILCAIDFSEHSRRALRLGLRLAAREGSRVVAVHVVDPLLAEAAASRPGAAELRADAESELEALVERERQAAPGLPPVRSIVRIGPPAREILASAQRAGATLVVMGTQGLGGLRKLLFGSIAEKVLRDAVVPVLAVPLPEAAGGDARTSDDPGVPDIDLVVAAIELDESAEAVIGHAISFARGFDLPLLLLHVVSPVEGVPRAVEAARAAEHQHESNAHARLTELAQSIGPGVTVDVEVRCGRTAEEIATVAAARQGLVTIASGGDTVHHRPGSIAYRVLCLSDAPVLTVPYRSDRSQSNSKTGGA